MKRIILTIAFLLTVSAQVCPQWFNQNSGLTSYLSQIFFVNENIGWIHDSRNIYNSTDGGYNWSIQMTQDSYIISKFYFIGEQIGWYTYTANDGSGGGIYKTIDGGFTWNLQFTTGQDVSLGDIQFIDSLNGWCVGIWSLGPGYFYKTTDGGENWHHTLGPTNLPFSLSFINNTTGWVAGSTIQKTTDSGANWVQQYNIDPKFFTYIHFNNVNLGWAISRGWWLGTEIYKTTNGGQLWTLHSNLPISKMTFIDEQYGWALSNYSILHSSNGGDDWVIQYVNNLKYLRSIFFIDSLNGWAVGDSGTILKTVNGGIIPVELISFSAILQHNQIDITWSTATETNNQGFSIERKFNSGAWKSIGFVEGQGTTTNTHHYTFQDEGLTPGIYLYRLKQIDYDGTFEYSKEIEVEVGIPDKFSLSQNYPNPFNPGTKISWQSPVGGYQTLKIYDVLGNEVATLVNEYRNAGSYEVEFNSAGLSSGVYFYRIQVGDFIETKKMVLLR